MEENPSPLGRCFLLVNLAARLQVCVDTPTQARSLVIFFYPSSLLSGSGANKSHSSLRIKPRRSS